jgi:hypothetical protein
MKCTAGGGDAAMQPIRVRATMKIAQGNARRGESRSTMLSFGSSPLP